MEDLKKKCTRCGKDFPIDEYHILKNGMFGRRSVCKSCIRDEYRTKNPIKTTYVESLSNEEWKDIHGYEGLYQISSLGRVKNLNKNIKTKAGWSFHVKETLLTPRKMPNGYLMISLHKDNKVKNCYVHRLVASAFLSNPQNLPQVNHKDENKTNNAVENLEWCDALYNINYGNARAKISATRKAKKLGKPVQQIDKHTHEVVAVYYNSAIAMEITGVDASAINKCCLGRPKFHTAGDYIWKYVE